MAGELHPAEVLKETLWGLYDQGRFTPAEVVNWMLEHPADVVQGIGGTESIPPKGRYYVFYVPTPANTRGGAMTVAGKCPTCNGWGSFALAGDWDLCPRCRGGGVLVCECGHAHEVAQDDAGAIVFVACSVCDCVDMVLDVTEAI